MWLTLLGGLAVSEMGVYLAVRRYRSDVIVLLRALPPIHHGPPRTEADCQLDPRLSVLRLRFAPAISAHNAPMLTFLLRGTFFPCFQSCAAVSDRNKHAP